MDDKQRARGLLAAEVRKDSDTFATLIEHGKLATVETDAAVAAITAALRAAPEVGRLLVLLEQWELRAAKAHPADAMLINKHIRELGSVLRGENLHDQRRVAVAADNSQVVTPPALGAHEVHPEAVNIGLDLAESGERLVAADALEHASGVRQGCDGSVTAPEGFVLVPVAPTDAMLDVLWSAEGGMRDEELQSLWTDVLAARPQGVKDAT